MNKEENQPLKIVIALRDVSVVILAITSLILTFTCLEERQLAAYEKETASVSDTICQTADTTNTEMRMALERAVVLERVKEIYLLVRNEYACNGGSYEYEWFDRAFCSKSWNKLLMAVRCKEERTGTFFFEVDRWSMLRYPTSYVSFEEFEVNDLWMEGNQKWASVSFVVYDGDTYTPARVNLVYEGNRWLIDDFHNLRYMLHMRNCMWDYLAHDLV